MMSYIEVSKKSITGILRNSLMSLEAVDFAPSSFGAVNALEKLEISFKGHSYFVPKFVHGDKNVLNLDLNHSYWKQCVYCEIKKKMRDIDITPYINDDELLDRMTFSLNDLFLDMAPFENYLIAVLETLVRRSLSDNKSPFSDFAKLFTEVYKEIARVAD